MFRKLTIALAATAAIGAAALTPTTASAGWGWHGHHGWHGHYGHGVRIGLYAPTYFAGSSCYVVKRVVATPYGPKVRRVTVCE